MANQAQKLPRPEVDFHAVAESVPPIPMIHVRVREPQVTEIQTFCLQRLSNWDSGAIFIQGASGTGKTFCIDTVLTWLRPLAAMVSDDCTVDIVQLDIMYHVAPGELFATIIAQKDIQRGERSAFQALRHYLSGLPKTCMMICVVENMDTCIQDEEWNAVIHQLCSLTDLIELTLIGTSRVQTEFIYPVPTQRILLHPYLQDHIRLIVTELLIMADVNVGGEFQNRLQRWINRFTQNQKELRLFYYMCSRAMKLTLARLEQQNGQPLQVHADDGVERAPIEEVRSLWQTLQGEIPEGDMNEVDTSLTFDISLHKRKKKSSQLLDWVILKFAKEAKWHVGANELMQTYHSICTSKQIKDKNMNQVKAMCSRYRSNGEIVWENNAITIPHHSYIREIKAIAIEDATQDATEDEE